jgi:hypothetical protein
MSRQATLLIADEIYYNLHGKALLHGIYSNDLVIPISPTTAAQLLFFFIIETDIAEPFQSLSVEVTLPGMPPVQNMVFIPPPQFVTAQAKSFNPPRTKYTARHPLLIPSPTLRPGRIEAKVIHEAGEIALTSQWITLNPPVSAAQTN